MASQTGALSGLVLAGVVLSATWILYGICMQQVRRQHHLKHYNGPKGGFLLGVAGSLAPGKINRVFTAWCHEYGPIFRLRVLWMQFIVVTDPVLATEAYNTKTLDKNNADYRRLDAVSAVALLPATLANEAGCTPGSNVVG